MSSPLPVVPAGVARRKHGPADVQRARELREAEWSYADIQRLLAKEGVIVHRRTIQLWTNPQAAETHRRNDLRVKARKRAARMDGRLLTMVSSPEAKQARMVALRQRAGLGWDAIAAVMRLDFDDDTTAAEVQLLIGDVGKARAA